MKRVFNKSNVFSFLIGILLCGSIVSAATLIDSKDVTYTSSDSSFDANNVESALDELYVKIGSKIDSSNAELIYLGNTKNITFSKDYSYVIVTGSVAVGGYSGVEAMCTTTATMSTNGYKNEYILNGQNPPVKIFTDVKKDATLSVDANNYNHWQTYMGILQLYITVIGIP